MLKSNESRQNFGEALADGISAILGRASSGSWLTQAHYDAGHVQITESLRGGPSAASYFAKQVEAISPAITRVTATPMSFGNPATYSIGITFDRSIVEALYSDGKDAKVSFEKDGKKYVVDKDGKAVEVEDPDKYVANLNKTTGSNYQKKAEDSDGDILASLQKLVDDANVALDGTGVEAGVDNGKIYIKGDVALVKPTQQALPDPLFGLEDLDGGYNNDTGAVEVVIPSFADERDVANLEEFLYKAVNIILDIAEKGDYTEEDEWARLIKDTEEDPAYAQRYAYAGESFIGESKEEGAKLVKSLLSESYEKALKVAEGLMGADVAKAVLEQYAPQPKSHPIKFHKAESKAPEGDADSSLEAILNPDFD